MTGPRTLVSSTGRLKVFATSAVPLSLAGFVTLFIALAVSASWRTSATWDEPIHLTTGYVALTRQDFRVDPSHPPLLRMWAALPLVALGPLRVDTQRIESAAPVAWLQDAYAFAHRFMYVDNDADRMLRASRVMMMLLGAALGLILFRWAREWLGVGPALVALVLLLLEPNIAAHASLVTTDIGVTLLIFATVYCLWLTCRRPAPLNLAALAACCGLAMAAKFSAVLLAPVVLVLLAIAVAGRMLPARTAVGVAALLTAASVAAIWASYGFRYLPSDSPRWVFDFAATDFAARSPTLAAAAGWIDAHHLLPNAYVQGFLYTQTSSQQLTSFLAGAHSTEGWWYYFPAAFLIKTPIALILLIAGGALLWAAPRALLTQRPELMPLAFVVVPVVIFLGAAMSSGINIGLRHILPVFPFLLLIAAAAARALLTARGRLGPAVLAVLLVACTAEYAYAYPHPLAFFNRLVGGPANGFRYLADSNLDWGQDLKPLQAWMANSGVSHLNLAYFGQADPAYYRMNVTHLPGAPTFAIDLIARPRLPGYVAISPTILQGVYAPPFWRLFYAPFKDLPPAAIVGGSMRVYWVERWPEATSSGGEPVALDTRRTLADALLLGMQWPELAVTHYREYLRLRPRDADALVHLGVALSALGRPAEALTELRQAMIVDPGHARAREFIRRLTGAPL